MKKILSLILVLSMVLALGLMFTSCGDDDEFKLGVILLHDEASTYDKNFIEAVERAKTALGLKDSQRSEERRVGKEC